MQPSWLKTTYSVYKLFEWQIMSGLPDWYPINTQRLPNFSYGAHKSKNVINLKNVNKCKYRQCVYELHTCWIRCLNMYRPFPILVQSGFNLKMFSLAAAGHPYCTSSNHLNDDINIGGVFLVLWWLQTFGWSSRSSWSLIQNDLYKTCARFDDDLKTWASYNNARTSH